MDSFNAISALVNSKTSVTGVMLAKLSRENLCAEAESGFRPISGLIIHLIVIQGTLKITVDNKCYACSRKENNLIAIKPMNSLTMISAGENFKGEMAVISRQIMDDIGNSKKTVPLPDMLSSRNKVVSTRKTSEIRQLSRYFNIMCTECVKSDRSILDRAIFGYAVMLFHMKIARMVITLNSRQDLSRTATLFQKFFNLIEENVEQQHKVSFYADKLCITPHYLTMLSNDFCGKPASKAIAEELIARASVMLRNPAFTLQMISEKLNFCDQSSFGKFFKKHTGKTPAAYRKEHK